MDGADDHGQGPQAKEQVVEGDELLDGEGLGNKAHEPLANENEDHVGRKGVVGQGPGKNLITVVVGLILIFQRINF